ncbi:MAG: SLBB domain-containing protein [Candidatus Hinthialibacter antarcticus]|nr:SLBB domain-containing protein [Candidatus Hinthialibacter antarcticus]
MTATGNLTWVGSIQQNGVVGAGGAGFPSYAKLKTPVEYVLLNGAECEPLLHKDKELMKRFPDEIVEGLKRVRDHLGASEVVLGVKHKYHDVIELLEARCDDKMRVYHLPDAYPAGDEFVLVYEGTGRVIPPGGLPLHVGCVVMNVETILNIVHDKPVTTKYLTVAGAVNDPKTVEVPIGVSIREVIEACGGASVEPYAVLTGGAMMGKLPASLDEPITKTTGGLLVFPTDHSLIHKYQRTETAIKVIGKSACDQCSFCTELCPRYLLGHPIEPHKAMRALGFSHEKLSLIGGSMFCCECNICSLIACPEDLDPKNVCVMNKVELRAESYKYPEDAPKRDVHGMREGRQTPISRLIQKLGLSEFTNKGPLTEIPLNPKFVTIPLRQHIGAPAQAAVKRGDRVRVGDVIGSIEDGQLGCPVHASMDGVVREVNETQIIIDA